MLNIHYPKWNNAESDLGDPIPHSQAATNCEKFPQKKRNEQQEEIFW